MSPISLDSMNVAVTKSRKKTYQQSSPETFPTASNQRDLPKHDNSFVKRVLGKLFRTKSSGILLISDLQKLEKGKQKLSCTRHSHDKSLTKPVRNKSVQLESSSKHLITDLWKLENIRQRLSCDCHSELNIHNQDQAKLELKSNKMAGRKRKQPENDIPSKSEYVAMDCEFVGAGPKRRSALGRCSVVDFDGHVLCDIYAKPDEPVTDYRTKWSGIRPRDLVNAVPFENARNIVRAALKDRIVVGHAVQNDFNVLKLNHPRDRIRDTSTYKPLRRMAGLPMKCLPSLKKLTKNLLGEDIQAGEHSSVEDSRATMEVFKIVRLDWEEEIVEEKERRDAQRNKRSRRDDDSTTTSSSSSSSNDDDDVSYYLSDAYWPDDY